jgi:hypothetical protein
MTAPIASGWSGCRMGFAPTRKRRLCSAHTHNRHQDIANKQLEASAYQCTQLTWYDGPLGIDVQRRQFLYVLGGAAVAWPHSKQTQEGLE